jgi:hypothetical protein
MRGIRSRSRNDSGFDSFKLEEGRFQSLTRMFRSAEMSGGERVASRPTRLVDPTDVLLPVGPCRQTSGLK